MGLSSETKVCPTPKDDDAQVIAGARAYGITMGHIEREARAMVACFSDVPWFELPLLTRRAYMAEAAAIAVDLHRKQKASMSKWTIAVITSWEDEPPDTLFENQGTVMAGSREEAVRIWGEEHPYDRDYCYIYARPYGTSWYEQPQET